MSVSKPNSTTAPPTHPLNKPYSCHNPLTSHTGAHLMQPSSEAYEAEDRSFRVSVARRLMLPHPAAANPADVVQSCPNRSAAGLSCNKPVDAQQHHCDGCRYGGGVDRRHAAVARCLADVIHSHSGAKVFLEPEVPALTRVVNGQREHARMDLVFNLNGPVTNLDVSTVAPFSCNPSLVSAAGTKPGLMAKRAEKGKCDRYPHINLVPFILETTGRPGPHARKFIADSDPECAPQCHLQTTTQQPQPRDTSPGLSLPSLSRLLPTPCLATCHRSCLLSLAFLAGPLMSDQCRSTDQQWHSWWSADWRAKGERNTSPQEVGRSTLWVVLLSPLPISRRCCFSSPPPLVWRWAVLLWLVQLSHPPFAWCCVPASRFHMQCVLENFLFNFRENSHKKGDQIELNWPHFPLQSVLWELCFPHFLALFV